MSKYNAVVLEPTAIRFGSAKNIKNHRIDACKDEFFKKINSRGIISVGIRVRHHA